MEKIFEKMLNNPLGLSIVGIVLMILMSLKHIHIIQLNSYNLDQQVIWYKKNYKNFFVNELLFVLTLFISVAFFILPKSHVSMPHFIGGFEAIVVIVLALVVLLVIPIVLLNLLLENLPRKQKKKLVFTKRIIRLLVICIILLSFWYLPAFLNSKNDIGIISILYGVSLTPVIVFVAFLISLPIENAIRKKFMQEAHKIIKSNDKLCVIGITGSFGKTSVKYYLSTILREKYSVCMTPESFNTSMGATLTIKNELRNIDDIFICEMGARRIGDIKEICDIVDPNGAIITDVGNMHLDTFKTIDNVRDTKFELVDAVYNNDKENKFGKGIVLLNGDNEIIREKANNYLNENKTKFFYGLNDNNDFYASNIIVNNRGTIFRFNSKLFGSENFETKLLGKYNIINLVAAIAYSLLLNVNILDIKNVVRKIEPVPHRLQILQYGNNELLIDDAYNSNPKGARNAVDVLNSFEGYKRVLITPGMVELNDRQDIENESFAEYAGKLVDYVVVVGSTNKLALNNGFEKSIDKSRILNFDKIEEAINYVVANISDKKVILLENDLSDNY